MSILYKETKLSIEKNKKNSLNSKFIKAKSTTEFEKICSFLESKYRITIQNLLGMGTSCVTYGIPNSNEAIKVCSRHIKYFKYEGHNLSKFVQDSKVLSPYVLPVNQLIMETPSYFVYTQFKCQPLKGAIGKTISQTQFNNIFLIIRSLFSKGLLVGQLRPKNLGFYNNKIVLFDYHSMHPLNKRTNKREWWSSLNGSIKVYSQLYGLKKDKQMTQNVNEFVKYIQRAKTFDQSKAIELIDNIVK